MADIISLSGQLSLSLSFLHMLHLFFSKKRKKINQNIRRYILFQFRNFDSFASYKQMAAWQFHQEPKTPTSDPTTTKESLDLLKKNKRKTRHKIYIYILNDLPINTQKLNKQLKSNPINKNYVHPTIHTHNKDPKLRHGHKSVCYRFPPFQSPFFFVFLSKRIWYTFILNIKNDQTS